MWEEWTCTLSHEGKGTRHKTSLVLMTLPKGCWACTGGPSITPPDTAPLWTPQSLSQQHHCQPHPCPLPHTQAHTHRHPGAPNDAQLQPPSLRAGPRVSFKALMRLQTPG